MVLVYVMAFCQNVFFMFAISMGWFLSIFTQIQIPNKHGCAGLVTEHTEHILYTQRVLAPSSVLSPDLASYVIWLEELGHSLDKSNSWIQLFIILDNSTSAVYTVFE